jgi:hypothetical protein
MILQQLQPEYCIEVVSLYGNNFNAETGELWDDKYDSQTLGS